MFPILYWLGLDKHIEAGQLRQAGRDTTLTCSSNATANLFACGRQIEFVHYILRGSEQEAVASCCCCLDV